MVSQAFLDDTQCRNCSGIPDTADYVLEDLWGKLHMDALEKLEPAECIGQYATSIQTNRRNLLLVASNDHFNQSERDTSYTDTSAPGGERNITNPNVYWTQLFNAADAKNHATAVESYEWICSVIPGKADSDCSTRVEILKGKPTTWHVGDGGFAWPVEYCLSEKAVPRCKLHFQPSIAIVVTILNFCKCLQLELVPLSPLRGITGS